MVRRVIGRYAVSRETPEQYAQRAHQRRLRIQLLGRDRYAPPATMSYNPMPQLYGNMDVRKFLSWAALITD